LTVCLRAGYLIWEKNTLATKDKKSSATNATSGTKVTRITATDSAKPAAKTPKKTTEAATTPVAPAEKKKKGRKNPIAAIGGYFAGAWYELRQVRWPNRKATWSLTVAVLAFTAFFMVLILLLDALFKYLFELILG
jgi:preprotein translocase SecE subunit